MEYSIVIQFCYWIDISSCDGFGKYNCTITLKHTLIFLSIIFHSNIRMDVEICGANMLVPDVAFKHMHPILHAYLPDIMKWQTYNYYHMLPCHNNIHVACPHKWKTESYVQIVVLMDYNLLLLFCSWSVRLTD